MRKVERRAWLLVTVTCVAAALLSFAGTGSWNHEDRVLFSLFRLPESLRFLLILLAGSTCALCVAVMLTAVIVEVRRAQVLCHSPGGGVAPFSPGPPEKSGWDSGSWRAASGSELSVEEAPVTTRAGEALTGSSLRRLTEEIEGDRSMISPSQSSRNPTGYVPQAVISGSQVRLQVLGESEEWVVTVVSSHLADPDADRISEECPIGEALLGRRAGDVIAVEVPVGRVQYRVLSVSPPDPQDELGSAEA
ncbi:MAG: GreA/GreB family elongation factor [Armatimonadota bacterium]